MGANCGAVDAEVAGICHNLGQRHDDGSGANAMTNLSLDGYLNVGIPGGGGGYIRLFGKSGGTNYASLRFCNELNGWAANIRYFFGGRHMSFRTEPYGSPNANALEVFRALHTENGRTIQSNNTLNIVTDDGMVRLKGKQGVVLEPETGDISVKVPAGSAYPHHEVGGRYDPAHRR